MSSNQSINKTPNSRFLLFSHRCTQTLGFNAYLSPDQGVYHNVNLVLEFRFSLKTVVSSSNIILVHKIHIYCQFGCGISSINYYNYRLREVFAKNDAPNRKLQNQINFKSIVLKLLCPKNKRNI